MPRKIRKRFLPVTQQGLQQVLQNLSNLVSALSPSAVALFNTLYNGENERRGSTKKFEGSFTTIKAILEATNDPYSRAAMLVDLVDTIFKAVTKAISKFEDFERDERTKERFEIYKKTQLMTCLDACLLIKEAMDKGYIVKEEDGKKNKTYKIAQGMMKYFLTYDLGDVAMEKLPDFNPSKPLENSEALFQQLCGELPVAPIAESIEPFTLLEWQRDMFNALRRRENVFVSAPTSSGKTMVALGYIVAFLQNESKSLLVYVVPNNVLALEISAILNKYQNGRVTTILDREEDRRMDERVIVCTPSGAINSGYIDTVLPENSLLVVDEVHAIANEGGQEMEHVFRELSSVQTLVLSATMTNDTVEKLVESLRNSKRTHIINERTQFIVQQDMVPRKIGENTKLVPMNPLGSLSYEELMDEELDLVMTPRDCFSLFVKIVKKLGSDNVPEYLAPVRFFFKYSCQVPEESVSLEDALDDEDEEEPENPIIRRLTMSDIAKWQKALINFMGKEGEKEKMEQILATYRMSLTDEATIECTPENAYEVAELMKEKEMFPALFFFPNLFNAIKYANKLVYSLAAKDVEAVREQKKEREKKSVIRSMENQIDSLKRAKGNGRLLRAKREEMELELERKKHSEMIAVEPERCLSNDGGISPESFKEFVEMLKRWNKNFTQSHYLAQMVLYGIGVLSGDMPLELQVYIRQLFSSGVIALLLTTSDCGYGINTPTRTVVLSSGLTEANRRQMKGRAGRKGLGYKAYAVSFRCDVAEARQHLTSLEGQRVELFEDDNFYDDYISQIEKREWNYVNQRDSEFYAKSHLLFGHGATLGKHLVSQSIMDTEGETNRIVKIILSLIPCTPFNSPYGEKEEWSYDLSEGVKSIYLENGLTAKPNYRIYQWLMNQKQEITDLEKEVIVENAKKWSYFIYLLKDSFSECSGGKKIYDEIQEMITKTVILTSSLE